MVYDPIRDCEVPSPATSHPGSASWRDGQYTRTTPGGPDGDRYGNINHPPAFHSSGSRSPSSSAAPHLARSMSGGGGLRGLLNEETRGRRASEQRSSVSSTATDENQIQQHYHSDSQPRPSIHQLLNSTPAPALSKSASSSSLTHSSSPSNQSPGSRHHYLDPNGFLTPGQAATGLRNGRSPLQLDTTSPGTAYHSLPPHELYDPHAGPSRRTSVVSATTPRPMLPPQDIPHPSSHPYYDPSRVTPSAHHLPLRSPSVSVSPRGYQTSLPPVFPSSRPCSSASASNPFAFQQPPSVSPTRSQRRLSEDFSRPPSGENGGRMGTMPQRRSSMVTPVYSPIQPVRSPSPIYTTPYDPDRVSQPTTVLHPISQEEVNELKAIGLANNPLRRRKNKRPLPSWSGQQSSSLPSENDSSYFPPQGAEQPELRHRHSQSNIAGRRSSISSAGRHSVTPGPSIIPMEVKSGGKRNISGEPSGNHLKRASDHDDGGHDTTRRKVSGTQYVGNAVHVADHYNSRPDIGVQHRELSPIIGLKKFNNWIKSVLIGKFAFRKGQGGHVLDIGCGKGGDLNKWKQARIRLYVGMDIAALSVDQARERFQKMNRPGFDAYFFDHDCYSKSIKEALPDYLAHQDLYDNVTMQFCMHYAFESASKARMMMENVSRYLKKGGVFLGTIPDSKLLLERLDEIPEDTDDLRFGNSCYFVTFTERKHKGMYGHQYRFYLEDAVGDVPEYIVNWENFESLALEYKLKLVYKKAFNEVLQEEQGSRDFGPLLGKMGVVNQNGESAMDADQWEAANLYMAFAFEKF